MMVDPHTLMVRKLESLFPLDDEEKLALRKLPISVASLDADRDVARIGDRPSFSTLLVSGFTSVYKVTSTGRRQIVGLHIPGDIPDLQSLHLTVLDNSVATVCPCTVGYIQHEHLRRISERSPRITAALWRQTLVDASIFREWIVNLGQREADARLAHVLCEFRTRLRVVGLADDDRFELPLTQVELADAIGTSAVHVNRVLKVLRSAGLVQTSGQTFTIPDWPRLKAFAEFDPLYLHLQQQVDA